MDGKEIEEANLNRKMEELSAEILHYPHGVHEVSRGYDLKNCPCKICQLNMSLSLLFT